MKDFLSPVIAGLFGLVTGLLLKRLDIQRLVSTDYASVQVAQLSEEGAFRKALLERIGALEARVDPLETVNEELRQENLALQTENAELKRAAAARS